MVCNLKIEKQRKLRVLVARDLMDIKGQPFDLKSYVQSIYNLIYDDTKDHAKALDYAVLVPLFVDQLASLDLEIKGTLRSKGVSFDALTDLLLQLNNPETTIAVIEDYLELKKDKVEELKAISEQISEEEPEPTQTEDVEEEAVPMVQGQVPITRLEVMPAKVTDEEAFAAAPPTAFADIFFEAASIDQNNKKYNVPKYEPFVQLQAKVKRYIVEELMKAGVDYQSSKMNIPGYGQVYLSMMSTTQIPQDSRDPSAPLASHEQGISLVLTDAYGEQIKFDPNTGQPTREANGRTVYFNVRKTSSVVDEEGNVGELSKEDLDRAQSLARKNKVGKNYTPAELLGAKEQIKSELRVIHQMRQAILNDKTLVIRNEITGGSLGYIKFDWEIRNKISKIDFAGVGFYPKKYPDVKGLNPNSHYFTVDDLYGKKLRVEQGAIKDTGLNEVLASLLVDPIMLVSKTGKLVPISKEERHEIVSTYIYTHPDRIQVYTDTLKEIRIGAAKYPVATPEQRVIAKNAVINYFNTAKKFANISEFPKLNIKESLINAGNFNKIDSTTLNEDDTVTLNFVKASYVDFIKDNTFINYELNAENKLVRLNPYFTFTPLEGDLEKVVPNKEQAIIDQAVKADIPKSTLTDKSSADNNVDDLLNSLWENPEFDKRSDLKSIEKAATKKQIAEAKVWYENSPLSKYFPFEALFNAVNTKRPSAAATWTMDGITLYKGSDYSDLYHEAFHGFTQAFLSQEDKRKLYGEAAKKTGTFTDYQGKIVSFAKATPLQLEEYLAEDFRNYMLKGQKVKEASPARNTIFRRLFNFLKAIFDGLTVRDVVENDRANEFINTIYEKVRVGNLSEYTFAQENAQFGELNTGIRPFTKDSKVEPRNYQDSMSLVKLIDSLLSEFVDRANNRLTTEELIELAEGQTKLAANTISPEERKKLVARLNTLESKKTYQYTSTLLKSQKGLKAGYRYVKMRMADLQRELNDKLQKTTDPQEQAVLLKSIQNLNFAITEFGNENDLTKNEPDAENNVLGLIAYHAYKSDILESKKVAILFAEDNIPEEETFVASRDGVGQSGNASSMKDLAKKEILTLLHTLYQIDPQTKKPVLDQYGVPQLTQFKEVWNRMVRMLSGLTEEEMEAAIRNEVADYPAFAQLLNKLGPLKTASITENALWTSLWRTFNPSKVPLIQVTVNRVTTRDKDGVATYSYETKIGEATGEFKKIGRDWENGFKTDYNNPYALSDDEGIYLNIDKVLKDFPEEDLSENRYAFFKALGFDLSDKKEIRKALAEDNVGGAKFYRQKLVYLQEKGVQIRRFKDLNKEYVFAGGKSDALDTRFSKLEELELRYSDRYANTMVSTATGNSQSEYTLNSTLTQLVNKLNGAKSYQDLISHQETAHYDILRNPFVKASVWMNSLFKMDLPKNDPEYGKRRKTSNAPDAGFVKLDLNNLSGVLFTIDNETTGNGVESAKADPFTKLIMDFHLIIQSAQPELLRHSDKSTSYSAALTHLFSNNSFKDNYIPSMSFFKGTFEDEALGILLPHIQAELARINIMRNAAANGLDKNFDQAYVKRGKNFVAFDTMLSKDTKEKLYNLPIDFDLSTAPTELLTAISEDIKKFFDYQTASLNNRFNKAKFISDDFLNKFKGTMNNVTHGKFPAADIQVTLIKSMVYNTWIHNLESMVMFYGDIAQYKVEKDDLHKRIAGIGSTGLLARTGENQRNFINTVLTRDYAKKLKVTPAVYDGTMATAVIQDKKTTSVYLKEQQAVLGQEGAIKYEDMEEGDGMGWISFDSYRILKNSQGQWLPAHEALYQNIVNNKPVDLETVKDIFFPTMKAQYFGVLQTSGLPITAFHKFQLFPLIPNVIAGSPILTALHDKMTREQVDYVLFKSGSKIATITAGNEVDDIYDNNTRQLTTAPFTKNVIFVDYLKDQLEIGSSYKGKVTFPTQLRTLVEEGLMKDGVPTDYTGTPEQWDSLSESSREAASTNYKLLKDFEKNTAALTEYKKKELLKKANWTINKKGELEGNIDDLVKFIKGELTRLDMGDHEVDFLQTHNGEMKFDLSVAPFAEQIEKLLNNIVTKELINQKVTGEALVQVSGAMFETAKSTGRNYTNPTAEDLKKWGSNDLPFYNQPEVDDRWVDFMKRSHPDWVAPKGYKRPTSAMKVKIALQGEFKKLLKLKHKDGEPMYTVERLNDMLKDEEWLNQGDHRRMITMVGVRIPVQGMNSMEFMEVYEFLPEAAGNIIVPPSEIVAKSGSDYDIDKLTIMMPSFSTKKGVVGLTAVYKASDKDTKAMYEAYKSEKVADRKRKVEGDKKIKSEEETASVTRQMLSELRAGGRLEDSALEALLIEDGFINSYEEFVDRLNDTSKGIENNLLWSIKSILEIESNYANLIRPNDTNIVKEVADEMRSIIPAYSKSLSPSGSEVLGYEFNLDKHNSNNAGKATLSIGAVGNKWNPLFNRIGMYLNPSAGITTAEKNKIEAKGKKATPTEKKALARYHKQELFLPHHTKKIGNEEGISLAGIMDVDGENRISDIINQMMNGWLDVAKDDWIFYIQGNEEITPSIEFLLEAGVPFKTAIYLVSQPLVRAYVEEQQLTTSTFADALGKAPSALTMARNKARANILNNPLYGFNVATTERKVNTVISAEAKTRIKAALGEDKFFDQGKLKASLSKAGGPYSEYEKAAFLHFLEIEEMAGAMRDVKLRMNVDTSKAGTLYEAQNKTALINDLKTDARIPTKIIEKLINDSPISSFFIQEFQNDIWGRFFPLRNHKAIRNFLIANVSATEVADTFGDKETFVKEFTNDVVSYIFQNAINQFSLKDLKAYRGFPVKEDPAQAVPITITDKVITVNKQLLLQQYVPTDPAFPTRREFLRFSFEKAYLLYNSPMEKVKDTLEYKIQRNLIIDKIPQLKTESAEEFKERRENKIYRLFIENKALDNVDNMHKLFFGKNTYASQFATLRRLYPSLAKDFDLVKQLSLSETKNRVNLKLNDTKLDGDAINIYHENLLNLADPQVSKVVDREANELISDFFKRFTTVAYLQSGLSTKNAFSLGRIVPPQQIQMLINEASKSYVEHFDRAIAKGELPAILDDIYAKFIANNSDYSGRIRGKRYTSNATLQASINILNGVPNDVVTEAPVKVTPVEDSVSPTSEASITYASMDELRTLHNQGKALYTMRVSEKQAKSSSFGFKGLTEDKNFGNPFTATGVKDLIQMEDTPAATEAYEKWLDGENIFIDKDGIRWDISGESARRDWINSQIARLKAAGGIQLGYFKPGYRSHASVLNEKINGAEKVTFGKLKPNTSFDEAISEDEAIAISQQGLSIAKSAIKKEPHWKIDEQMANESTKAIAAPLKSKTSYKSSSNAYVDALRGKGVLNKVDFHASDKVWIFGNLDNYGGITKADNEANFKRNYVPLIEKARAQGVTVFNVGTATGIDTLTSEYLKLNGFVPVRKGDWNQFVDTFPDKSKQTELSVEETLEDEITYLGYELAQLEELSEMSEEIIEVKIARALPKINTASAESETGSKAGKKYDIDPRLVSPTGPSVKTVADDLAVYFGDQFQDAGEVFSMDGHEIRTIIIEILRMGKEAFIAQYVNNDAVENLKRTIAYKKVLLKSTPSINKTTGTINIYAGTKENAGLSNFANRPVTVNGLTFNTVEGAFQAAKLNFTQGALLKVPMNTVNKAILKQLQTATGPKAKQIGGKIGDLQRSAWDKASSAIMKNILRLSFEQNPEALSLLLATGTNELTHIGTEKENRWTKEFPKLLMEVREELRNPTEPTADDITSCLS